MKKNWISTSIISGIIGGFITFVLTGNWKLSLISGIIILIIVQLNNPKRRYIKAFYIVSFPLLFNIYFTINSTSENFDIQAGLKELDMFSILVLGSISVVCLILDYLERNNKLGTNIFEINTNINNGSGNVSQIINKKDNSNNND